MGKEAPTGDQVKRWIGQQLKIKVKTKADFKRAQRAWQQTRGSSDNTQIYKCFFFIYLFSYLFLKLFIAIIIWA